MPTFVGGLLLSGLADRWPRRQVMIGCDLSRAVLVGLMALPGMPLGVRVGLLFLVTLVSAPFTSARAALYPDILAGDRYVLGTAVTLTTLQFAQVLGFAAGGAAVAFFGVRASLLADAATFILSALITGLWVRSPARRAGRAGAGHRSAPTRLISRASGLRAGLGWSSRLAGAAGTPMLFGWLSAFYNVPGGHRRAAGRAPGRRCRGGRPHPGRRGVRRLAGRRRCSAAWSSRSGGCAG